MELQPHIQLRKKQVSSRVLLPGDPGRVKQITEFLENPKKLSSNREFISYSGEYKGKRIIVCSTGIGGPSTAIVVEELIALGARTLIRIGTCGGAWKQQIKSGSLVIPTACVRDEGTTKEYIDSEFPAVADFEIITALSSVAKRIKIPSYVGINRSHDGFYGNEKSILRWGDYLSDDRFRKEDTPILSSEMECAALFVIASLRNVKAGAVLAVNTDPEPLRDRLINKRKKVKTETSKLKTKEVINNAIQVALDAITQN